MVHREGGASQQESQGDVLAQQIPGLRPTQQRWLDEIDHFTRQGLAGRHVPAQQKQSKGRGRGRGQGRGRGRGQGGHGGREAGPGAVGESRARDQGGQDGAQDVGDGVSGEGEGVPASQDQDTATQPHPDLPAAEELPSLEELHTTLVPTLKWCPRGARGDLARELASLWHRMADNPGEIRLWALESMFSRAILPAGRGPRAGDGCSQSRLVRERLRRWRAGEYSQLWEEAKALTKEHRPRGRRGRVHEPENSQEKRNAERATTLAQEGQYTRALQALTSAGMAPQSRATQDTMKGKHPPSPGPLQPSPTTAHPQLTFSQLEVEKAARRFRRGSAPGPSGMRPEHILVTLQAAPGRRDKALQGLTRLTNVMAGGGVPEEVAPYLCGARLHAALKKDGGIRPIAVGNLLRRLVGKCCASELQHRAATLLSPNQLGVGVRGGCEAIVHTVREPLKANPSLYLLQADLVNAFNLADRAAAMEDVAKLFPEILAWVTTCYGKPSHLLFGAITILSERGFHQGDPLAALLFALVLHPLVLKIQERVPGLAVNAWFLDDGSQVGTLEELREVTDILVEEGPARGLTLSTAATVQAPGRPKTTIWRPSGLEGEADPLGRGVVGIEEAGVILLGAPLGSEEYVKQEVEKKVEKVREISGLLPQLEDPHTEYVLLRSCLSLPKLSFLLRAVDTTQLKDQLKEFDSITREGLTRILGTPLSDRPWQQAKLPVSMGGMGLRAAEDHAPAAHAASVLALQPLSASLLRRRPKEPSPPLPQLLLDGLTIALGEETSEESLEGVF